jgi:hypothetical protein
MGKVCIWFGGAALALFIGYATVPSNTASWVIAVLWWGFIVAGVAFFLTGFISLILIARRHQNQLTKRGQTVDESKEEKQFKLDVGKLLLDGKEILVDLERMYAQLDWSGAVSPELKCEMWYKDASKTLQNTDYDRLWFENKEGLDYRTANKSDYVEACKYGLDRLEYIKQLIFDKEGSQLSQVNGTQINVVPEPKPELKPMIHDYEFDWAGGQGYPPKRSEEDKALWLRLGVTFKMNQNMRIETFYLLLSGDPIKPEGKEPYGYYIYFEMPQQVKAGDVRTIQLVTSAKRKKWGSDPMEIPILTK